MTHTYDTHTYDTHTHNLTHDTHTYDTHTHNLTHDTHTHAHTHMHTHNLTHDTHMTHAQVCTARLADFHHHFSRAARQYIQLSYELSIHPEEQLTSLKCAMNCTILSQAGGCGSQLCVCVCVCVCV